METSRERYEWGKDRKIKAKREGGSWRWLKEKERVKWQVDTKKCISLLLGVEKIVFQLKKRGTERVK